MMVDQSGHAEHEREFTTGREACQSIGFFPGAGRASQEVYKFANAPGVNKFIIITLVVRRKSKV